METLNLENKKVFYFIWATWNFLVLNVKFEIVNQNSSKDLNSKCILLLDDQKHMNEGISTIRYVNSKTAKISKNTCT